MHELHRWTGDEPADPPTLPLLYNIVYCSRASGTLDQAALQRIVATAQRYNPAHGITGMLVFSGCGSYFSERYLDRARSFMPKVFLAIFLILVFYAFTIDYALDWIGTLPYALRIVLCLLIVFPPAFLMGFPMPTAMTMLGRLGKDHMFLWAWGINGCFSVIGAALVPIVTEAGGTFTDLQGQPGPGGGSAIATNGHLHEDVLTRLGHPRLSGLSG